MPKFTDYAAKTIPDDSDILLIQDASATKKITFLNIFNRVKTKLGLGTLATKNTISQSDLETALADLITEKLTASGIANNLTTTDATKVLSAPQGKNLSDSIVNISKSIGTLDSLTTTEKANLVAAMNELVTSLNTLNSNIDSINGRLPGFNTKRLSVTTGKTGIYLKLETSNWNKCFALVIGGNNISEAVQETVFACYNSDNKQVELKSKGSRTWNADQAGQSVSTSLSVGSELLVIYVGFTVAGVF